MTRGWTSQDLPVVDDDPKLWTVTDAVVQLGTIPGDPDDMPMLASVVKLRDLIRYFRLQPVGKRRSSRPGQPGRFARVYLAQDIIALYERMDFDNAENPPAAA